MLKRMSTIPLSNLVAALLIFLWGILAFRMMYYGDQCQRQVCHCEKPETGSGSPPPPTLTCSALNREQGVTGNCGACKSGYNPPDPDDPTQVCGRVFSVQEEKKPPPYPLSAGRSPLPYKYSPHVKHPAYLKWLSDTEALMSLTTSSALASVNWVIPSLKYYITQRDSLMDRHDGQIVTVYENHIEVGIKKGLVLTVGDEFRTIHVNSATIEFHLKKTKIDGPLDPTYDENLAHVHWVDGWIGPYNYTIDTGADCTTVVSKDDIVSDDINSVYLARNDAVLFWLIPLATWNLQVNRVVFLLGALPAHIDDDPKDRMTGLDFISQLDRARISKEGLVVNEPAEAWAKRMKGQDCFVSVSSTLKRDTEYMSRGSAAPHAPNVALLKLPLKISGTQSVRQFLIDTRSFTSFVSESSLLTSLSETEAVWRSAWGQKAIGRKGTVSLEHFGVIPVVNSHHNGFDFVLGWDTLVKYDLYFSSGSTNLDLHICREKVGKVDEKVGKVDL